MEEVLRQAELAEKTKSKASVNTNGTHVGESGSASIDADYEDGELEDEDLEESTAHAENGDGIAHGIYNTAAAPPAISGDADINGHQPTASLKGIIHPQ